ncbi:F0F1 ATP synthase subunit epsilon [bacterium]|nr:F0F1 ATP synthase subunit epsilon [bacterium]
MKLGIATPEKVIYTGEVENVNIPTFAGNIGVLSHHTALISIVKAGEIIIKEEKGNRVFKNEQGVIEIHNNKACILLRNCVEIL